MNINSEISKLIANENNEVNLYHLGICDTIANLRLKYGGIKAVIMGGKGTRMEQLAAEFEMMTTGKNSVLVNIAKCADRYFMCKVGNVIFLSHGMGNPSISIALHELAKLLYVADSRDAVVIRFGTCGGIGIEPGSIVLTQKCLTPSLQFYLEKYVCGKAHKRELVFDAALSNKLMAYSEKHKEAELKMFKGTTFCTNDFYEEQARLDGAIRVIGLEEKMNFMQRLNKEFGVVNIEMEASEFGMFCGQTGLRGMVVCMALVNRLKDDNVGLSKQDTLSYQARFSKLLLGFVKDL